MAARTSGWRIGSLAGVPVYLGRSWLIVAAVVVLLLSPVIRAVEPGVGAWAYAAAFGFAVLLLISVLVHEAAHALVARACGYRVSRMVADFWGGHTAYENVDSSPGRSALVAVAGPAANGLLAFAGWALTPLASGGGVPSLLLAGFVWANAFVAVFNLLPGLPLDGGFLVDALVWRLTGSRGAGTLVAGWTGRLLTLALVWWALGVPLLQGREPTLTRIGYTVLIGSFLWVGASDAIRVGRARRELERIRLGQVLRPVRVVAADAPVALLAGRADGIPLLVSDAAGTPVGLVDEEALARVPSGLSASTPVASVMVPQPPKWVVTADPDDDLTDVVVAMQSHRLTVVALRGRDGALYGVVRAADL